MKITKRQLRRIIREAMDTRFRPVDDTIPIEGLEFTPNDDGKMMVQSYYADGAVTTFSTPQHFEVWKVKVVKRYPGSAAIRSPAYGDGDRWVWMPASGPWKDTYDANMGEKARSVGKYGSH